MTGALEFGILGPLEVRRNGELLALGRRRQQALLALLLIHANEVVAFDRIVDELWGEQPSENTANTLHVYVSALRKVLEPGNSAKTATVLVTKKPGYVVYTRPSELDAWL